MRVRALKWEGKVEPLSKKAAMKWNFASMQIGDLVKLGTKHRRDLVRAVGCSMEAFRKPTACQFQEHLRLNVRGLDSMLNLIHEIVALAQTAERTIRRGMVAI